MGEQIEQEKTIHYNDAKIWQIAFFSMNNTVLMRGLDIRCERISTRNIREDIIWRNRRKMKCIYENLRRFSP